MNKNQFLQSYMRVQRKYTNSSFVKAQDHSTIHLYNGAQHFKYIVIIQKQVGTVFF